MIVRRLMRESAFRLARRDLAMFLEDHEEELMQVFREEMQRLDDEIPEENLFIDIKMVPLGEMILKAVLRAVRRFLTGEITAADVENTETAAADLAK
jgi:hypothetical protein